MIHCNKVFAIPALFFLILDVFSYSIKWALYAEMARRKYTTSKFYLHCTSKFFKSRFTWQNSMASARLVEFQSCIQESVVLLQLRSTCGGRLLAAHRSCGRKQEKGSVTDPPCRLVGYSTICPNQRACLPLHGEQARAADVHVLQWESKFGEGEHALLLLTN